MPSLGPLLIVGALIVGVEKVEAPTPAPPAYEPTENYRREDVRGWTIYVHRSLFEEHEELTAEVLELLSVKLYDIVRAVPPQAVEKLRQAPIWVEYRGRSPCACYHPSREWLKANGYNPDKAGAVEIANAATFLRWTREQPSMVLHELAHAYHDRFLDGGYGNEKIAAAYRAAMEKKLYDSVLRYTGQTVRAYAANNPQEYFAELTEAWFGQNDFYPFVRAEVAKHDPEGAELLKEIWGE